MDAKQVSADAKGVLHVDVDAMRDAVVVKNVWRETMDKYKDVKAGVYKLLADTGIDLAKDMHGVTVYGKEIGGPQSVVIVNADMDQKYLLAKVARAPDYKTTTYGSYELHSWYQRRGPWEHRRVGLAFFKPSTLVFATSPDETKAALDVLDGKAPSLDGKDNPLAAPVPPGTAVVIRIRGLADLRDKVPPLKNLDRLSIAVGEHEGESFFTGTLLTADKDTAERLQKIVEGGVAIGELRFGDEAALMQLLEEDRGGRRGQDAQSDVACPG